MIHVINEQDDFFTDTNNYHYHTLNIILKVYYLFIIIIINTISIKNDLIFTI